MRARNLKPGFFRNEDLATLPHWQRLLFAGTWLIADRAGRFEYRPRRIKRELFPEDAVDIAAGIAALEAAGFLRRYTVEGVTYVQVLAWRKHQNPHKQEAPSVIPGMTSEVVRQLPEVAPESHGSRRADSLIPDSLTPDSLIPKQEEESTATRIALRAPRLELPAWMPVDVWKRWHDYRQRRGKGWTVDAQKLSLRTLGKLRDKGDDPLAVIEQSIERGWTGLFTLKGDSDAGHGTRARGQGVADRTIAHARRHGIV